MSNVVDDHDYICHHNPRYVDIHFDLVDCVNDDDVSYEMIHGVNPIDFDDVFYIAENSFHGNQFD
jgi:hypothetical protein